MFSILVANEVRDKKFKDTLIRASFFIFQGILGSIFVNDLIRVLYGNLEHKDKIEYGIAAGISLLPHIHPSLVLFDDRTNNYFMSFGMFIGVYLANDSERKRKKV